MPLFRKPLKLPDSQLNQELRIAAAQGNKELVLEKLAKGAKFIPDKDGRTALHIASLSGHAEIVSVFVKSQSDLNLQDKLGYTALHRASLEGQDEVVRILIDAGADVNKKDFVQENTPMHEAASEGHQNVLQLLHSANADLYIRNKIGATPLHVAAQKGRTSVVRWFLQSKCKADVKDKYDDTPLHTAIRHLHSGAAKVLLSFGAPTNEQNKNGDTPLHLACNLGQKKLTKLLVQAGASSNLKNKQNETPKDIAGRRQSSELNQILQSTSFNQSGLLSPITSPSGSERKHWKRARKSKIRARLEEAKKAGSNWHLLFQDWVPRESEFFGSKALENRWEPPLLRKGEQFFVDLAGNIQKGPSGKQVACYCAPFFGNIVKQNTDAQQELLDEIDACHDELSHEINDLRQVTRRHLADIEKDLHAERRSRRKQGREPSGLDHRLRKIRSRSESEMEVDLERGRMGDAHGSDSYSNASDDIYLERYWKATELKTRRSARLPSSSQDSQSRDSSKRSRKKKLIKQSVQDAFQETLRQFNRFDLDDSCTTPTSGSSQPYTGTATSHSEMSQEAKQAARILADTEEPGSRRASLYSCRSTNSAGNQCPQPPSLDSGYGTGMSPSPAVSRSDQNSTGGTLFNNNNGSFVPLNMLIEVSTQTESSSTCTPEKLAANEYMELEGAVRGHAIVGHKNRTINGVRCPPKLIIPPPPRHPVPPVPTESPVHKRTRGTASISTNV